MARVLAAFAMTSPFLSPLGKKEINKFNTNGDWIGQFNTSMTDRITITGNYIINPTCFLNWSKSFNARIAQGGQLFEISLFLPSTFCLKHTQSRSLCHSFVVLSVQRTRTHWTISLTSASKLHSSSIFFLLKQMTLLRMVGLSFYNKHKTLNYTRETRYFTPR